MSSKTLLCAVAALALAVCSSPTEAMTDETEVKKVDAPRLEIAPAARAALAAFAASPTERLGCLLGSVVGATVRVNSVSATDDSGATATRTVARAPCPSQAVGRVHSHPGGERCWYWFPGTQVETSDAVSFRRGGYPVDAIVCGQTLVYVTRDGGPEARSLALADRTVPIVLASAAAAFTTAEDSVMHEPFAGRAVDWAALAIGRRDGRQLDWGSIGRWARAIRSWRPRISQSVQLTASYRRSMGARLGMIVDF